MGKAFVQRIASRVDDVAGRIEIGLTDLKMNDVAALRFKCARLYQNFEGRLGAKARHPFGKTKFASFTHRGEPRLCAMKLFSQLRKGNFPEPSRSFALDALRIPNARLSRANRFARHSPQTAD